VNTPEKASVIKDIRHPDVQAAGRVLASAFRNYPFFEYCLGDAINYDRLAPGIFASFVRWTMLYGKAWATSDLNAVALRQPPGTRSIGFWNAMRSGLTFSFLRMDGATRRRFSRTTPLDDSHVKSSSPPSSLDQVVTRPGVRQAESEVKKAGPALLSSSLELGAKA
jgi:hypothetical protein